MFLDIDMKRGRVSGVVGRIHILFFEHIESNPFKEGYTLSWPSFFRFFYCLSVCFFFLILRAVNGRVDRKAETQLPRRRGKKNLIHFLLLFN